jgi:tyrosinase
MVDRCFAMWQVLNPGSYVVSRPATYGTFTSYARQTQDSNTALTPFYKDSLGAFWTSAEVVNTTTFGYTYSETASSTTSQVIAAINKLYGPKSQSNFLDESSEARALESARSSKTHKEWIANIRVKKYALNSLFFVHIFLGNVGPDPALWSFDTKLVGSHGDLRQKSFGNHELILQLRSVTNGLRDNSS